MECYLFHLSESQIVPWEPRSKTKWKKFLTSSILGLTKTPNRANEYSYITNPRYKETLSGCIKLDKREFILIPIEEHNNNGV